jgi:GT2 family glycosyltransferase
MTPRASIVIPTWNGAALLNDALLSLRRQTRQDFEIIVVDNGSTDGTAELLTAQHPDVRLIELDRNRGFAAAVNEGIGAARGDIVVLMNNDVEAAPGWIAALIDAMDAHPAAGACASRMLSHADPSRIDSAGDRFGLFATSIGHGEMDGPAFDVPAFVLSACAGAAAYRRTVLDATGAFDERFFAYLEDIDLGIRFQLAGWDCLYVPDAIVYHHGSATARRIPERKLFLLMRNSLFLFFQYMPMRTLLVWGPAMLAWPLYRVLRERQPLRLGLRAVAAFLRDIPAVRRRRVDVALSRRLTNAEFNARLSGWRGGGPSRPAPPAPPAPAPRSSRTRPRQ